MRKSTLFSLLLGLVVLLAGACSQSNKTPKNNAENSEQISNEAKETAQNADNMDNQVANDRSDYRDPLGRVANQLSKIGSELSQDQMRQINEISSRYNLQDANSPEERKAMLKQMQEEINGVLTPEQRAKLEEMRRQKQN